MKNKKTLRENMLNVLMYLFENHMQDNCELTINRDQLISELNQIGFHQEAINKALNWLEGLTKQQETMLNSPPQKSSIRIFSNEEITKMDSQCRNQLMHLEKLGILTTETREIVINQIMQLDRIEVDLGQVNWVALMVLFNQPDQKNALSCLEHLVLSDTQGNMQ